jgi:hypothetical protein
MSSWVWKILGCFLVEVLSWSGDAGWHALCNGDRGLETLLYGDFSLLFVQLSGAF